MSDMHERHDGGEPGSVPVSIERAISQALAEMRHLAADAGTDDDYETWSREVLERRPLILVAVAMHDGAWMWMREPGHDGVLHAEIRHRVPKDEDGEPLLDPGHAELEFENRALEAITREVSWLVKDRYTGQHLHQARLTGA